MSKEKEDILTLIDEQGYIKKRLEDQIQWYDKASIRCKKYFMRLQVSSIVASTSVPIFAYYSDKGWARLTVAIIGVLAAVFGSIIALYRFRENWIDYRTTAENLKHEKWKYLTRATPYKGDNSFPLLIHRVEDLVSEQHSTWRDRQSNSSDDSE